MARWYALIAVSLLAGCATAYKPSGFMGGFSETALAPNVYRVHFRGNAYTAGEKASDYALLRGAELMAQGGFPYFAVTDEASWQSMHVYNPGTRTTTTGSAYQSGGRVYGQSQSHTTGGPTTMYKPASKVTVYGFSGKPEGVFAFDTAFIINSIRGKYGIDPPSE